MRQHLYHVKLVPSPLGGNLWGAFLVMNASPRRLGRKPVMLAKKLESVMNRIRDRLADRDAIVDEAAQVIVQSTEDEYHEWYREYRFGS